MIHLFLNTDKPLEPESIYIKEFESINMLINFKIIACIKYDEAEGWGMYKAEIKEIHIR